MIRLNPVRSSETLIKPGGSHQSAKPSMVRFTGQEPSKATAESPKKISRRDVLSYILTLGTLALASHWGFGKFIDKEIKQYGEKIQKRIDEAQAKKDAQKTQFKDALEKIPVNRITQRKDYLLKTYYDPETPTFIQSEVLKQIPEEDVWQDPSVYPRYGLSEPKSVRDAYLRFAFKEAKKFPSRLIEGTPGYLLQEILDLYQK